jgi:prolyl-tRNA editing enzyme YbaK/EbsC (Cys-tRNA(Pro) deacylase)
VTTTEHAGIRRVADALTSAGMVAAAEGIRFLDADVRTAAHAAAAVGVETGAIANSLVFRAVTGEHEVPLLVLTSGAHRADTATLARLIGAERVGKADPDFVRVHTGQTIGGVAPIGHPSPVRTLVDDALAGYPLVWAAAGHPRAVFPATFEELVSLTGGTPASVAGQEDDRQP